MTMTAHMTGRGLTEAVAINAKALRHGGERIGALSTRWDLAGSGKLRCSNPVATTNKYTQPVDDWIVGLPPGRPSQYVDLETRCRECDNCLKLRSWEWTQRMRRELLVWPRTWFGTLTCAPMIHDRVANQARLACGKRGIRFDGLSEGEQFLERCKVLGRQIELYSKKVREAATAPVRLVVVTEKHKSGLPHYHALFHETQLGCLSERVLSKRWGLGHTQWRVVHDVERASRYVAKYLSKSLLSRIRASQGYGSLERVATHRTVANHEMASDPDNALKPRAHRDRESVRPRGGGGQQTPEGGSIPPQGVSAPMPAQEPE